MINQNILKKLSYPKAFILIFCSMLIFTGFARALLAQAGERPGDYGVAGCGLGAAIVGKDGNQMAASIINSLLFPFQISGIISDILNCDAGTTETAVSDPRKDQFNFVQVNYSGLESEAAVGQGPALESLAILMGCANTMSFTSAIRQNHGLIFKKSDNQTEWTLARIEEGIASNPSLAQSCSISI